MIPKFIEDEILKWINSKSYGDLRIMFQNGRIQRWINTFSYFPPGKSSGTSKTLVKETVAPPKALN